MNHRKQSLNKTGLKWLLHLSLFAWYKQPHDYRLLQIKESHSKQQAQDHKASEGSDTNTNIKNRQRLIKWQVVNTAKNHHWTMMRINIYRTQYPSFASTNKQKEKKNEKQTNKTKTKPNKKK